MRTSGAKALSKSQLDQRKLKKEASQKLGANAELKLLEKYIYIKLLCYPENNFQKTSIS